MCTHVELVSLDVGPHRESEDCNCKEESREHQGKSVPRGGHRHCSCRGDEECDGAPWPCALRLLISSQTSRLAAAKWAIT